MLRLRAFVLTLCCILVASAFAAGPAAGQAPTPRVSLYVTKKLITYGDKVRLSGHIWPRSGGQQVNIISDGAVIATDRTNQDGRYVVWKRLPRNRVLRAQWATAISDPEHVRVKPRVRTRLGGVRLFKKARVSGSITPRQRDRKIEVKFLRKGRTIAKKRVPLRKGKYFSTRFSVRSVAPVRAKAKLDVKGMAPGGDGTRRRSAPTPYLSEGSSGPYVRILERRLRSLGYRMDAVDRSFNYTTQDALIAFHKVQGLPRVESVADYTWRALTHPFKPKPVTTKGFHFEVDQTRQVLYIVKRGEVRTIVHVSTGANGYTRDGLWTVFRQLQGTSGGGLYYPSYFDGRRAVHGWSSVPTYPASHGCVRTPMWIAPWLNDKAFIGMKVHVYHS